MKSKAQEVRHELLARATDEFDDDPRLDWEFVKANAPTWREVSGWKPDGDNRRDEDLNELAQQKLLERFHKHFRHEAKTNPSGLQEAFERFLAEQSEGEQDELEEENEGNF